MADPNWARWIHASVAIYLKQIADEANVPALVEGIEDRTKSFTEAPYRLEIRVNGPFSREISKDYHEIIVGVNVLVNSQMGGTAANPYEQDRILGLFHEAMDGNIAIFRHGTGPDDDDESLVGCIKPRPGKNDYIRVLRFGQLTGTDRITQGMVDATYQMFLSE